MFALRSPTVVVPARFMDGYVYVGRKGERLCLRGAINYCRKAVT